MNNLKKLIRDYAIKQDELAAWWNCSRITAWRRLTNPGDLTLSQLRRIIDCLENKAGHQVPEYERTLIVMTAYKTYEEIPQGL